MEQFKVLNENELRSVIKDAIKEGFADGVSKFEMYKQEPKESVFDDLITRKEAAKMLGVTLVTLSTWGKLGKINCYNLNTRIRYKKSEVEHLIKNPIKIYTDFKELVLEKYPAAICQYLVESNEYFIITESLEILNMFTAKTEKGAWGKAARQQKLC